MASDAIASGFESLAIDALRLADEYRKCADEVIAGTVGATARLAVVVRSIEAFEEAHATELDRMAAECERLERERDIANAQAARLAERLAALTP
jgi:hypothetical protein